jgi:cell division protease FtsH
LDLIINIKEVSKGLRPEDKLMQALKEQEEQGVDISDVDGSYSDQTEKRKQTNKTIIGDFLGKHRLANAVTIVPRYYAELLAWALQRYLERRKWQVIRVLSYELPEPIYTDVYTAYDSCEYLLNNGRMLLERNGVRFTVTVDINRAYRGMIRIEGVASRKKEIEAFISGVEDIVEKQNIYRGKIIEFGGRIRFLDVKNKSWGSIVLNPLVKTDIRSNTVGFLNRKELWSKYGIPSRRGILLAGEPGTGKTVICRALMAESDGITCITTDAYCLSEEGYITELYEMAGDLSPSIVFIEDIDFIGLNREEYNYRSGPVLLALLSVLDGIEEKQEIITIATTNNLESLDRALTKRPSRFDHVIKIPFPEIEERKELINLLCQKIPLDKESREYIAQKAEYCTPAQLQEIIFSLAIEYQYEASDDSSACLKPCRKDMDRVISRINGRNKLHLGFKTDTNHNGNQPDLTETVKLN